MSEELKVLDLIGRLILVKSRDKCSNCGRGNQCEAKQILETSKNKKAVLTSSQYGGGSEWVTIEKFNEKYIIVDATNTKVQTIDDLKEEEKK